MKTNILQIWLQIRQKILDTYRGLSLRSKFSLFIGVITLFVILVLSLAVLEAEKYVLRGKVEEICRLSVQNLSSVAKDNLLIQNYAPIQDVINNMVRLKIEGFEEAYVLNRDGVIVAHSNPNRINMIDSLHSARLINKEQLFVVNHPNDSEYMQSIAIARESEAGRQWLSIGLAGVKFSHSMIQSALGHARRVVFGITVGVILLSVWVVSLLSKRLSSNITKLASAVREVANGNLDITIELNSRDELGLLATEFNKMVRSLRENLEMRKFVSPLTIDMIQNQAQSGNFNATMKKEAIAVLFSDIRGFTSLSEKLEPEQLMEVVNVYLEMQSRFIESNGGLIDKFAGDLVMAIFQGEEAVDNAVKSAVDIQRAMKEINRVRRKENRECLSVGIGINYGTAMLGSMGAKSRMDYTAIGDVVHLASKLCSFARSGHIVVTKNVIRRLKGSFSVIKMEPVRLSGRQNPVPVYRVVY